MEFDVDERCEDWDGDFETWNNDHTVMVAWEYLDEGAEGDYDPDDPDDYPHLRFSVYRKKEYEGENVQIQVDDSSYCTLMPVATPKEVLVKLAKYILNCVECDVKNEYSIKKCCERLSWIDEGVLE